MSTRDQFPDHVLNWLRKEGIPVTRANYLAIAYLGDPPKELSAEEEADLPKQIRKRPRRRKKS